MAGRPPEVDHVRGNFLQEIESARNLTDAILALPARVNPTAGNGLHPKHVRQVVELAFMGMVDAWEEFLDRSLVRYVAGAKTTNGYSPTAKFGLANNIPHAYQLLAQNTAYDPLKNFLKVTDPKWVWTTADFFFKSHPYTSLQAKTELLHRASSIRNRVAHSSEKCRADFKATAVYFLRPKYNTLTQGYGPGNLLRETVQRHFGRSAINKGLTHFEAYARLYEALARQIVP